jgi:anaerobic ribonucleoside-triphosphate reductase activating protein
MKLCGIEMDSVVDGPGIRMTVFFQGCPHHCEGCHNPETWDYDAECMEMSVAEVLKLFDGDSILTGLTLSGGEPLSPRNFEEIFELVREMKKRNKNVWVFTGYTIDKVLDKYPNLREDLLPYVDVVVDGPFVLSQRDLMLDFRGSRNQRLIDIPKYLNNESDFILKR